MERARHSGPGLAKDHLYFCSSILPACKAMAPRDHRQTAPGSFRALCQVLLAARLKRAQKAICGSGPSLHSVRARQVASSSQAGRFLEIDCVP